VVGRLLDIAYSSSLTLPVWYRLVQDFTPEWYPTVGAAIVSAVAMQVLAMQALPLGNTFVRFPLKRLCKRGGAVTQRELVGVVQVLSCFPVACACA